MNPHDYCNCDPSFWIDEEDEYEEAEEENTPDHPG